MIPGYVSTMFRIIGFVAPAIALLEGMTHHENLAACWAVTAGIYLGYLLVFRDRRRSRPSNE